MQTSSRPLPMPPSPKASDQTLQELQVNMAEVPDDEDVVEEPQESLERLEPKAENEIEEVGEMLKELTSLHGTAELEEVAKKLVEGVSNVLEYLGAVAEIHPIAGIVVSALTRVVNLELQRHENNAHIVVVHATMVKTVYHVRFLTRIQTKFEEELEQRLNVIFNHMVNTIREFGACYPAQRHGFLTSATMQEDLSSERTYCVHNQLLLTHPYLCSTYHTCWQKTYKVLFSHIHKKKLEHFSSRFQQHREDLDEMRKTMTQMQLASVFDNTEEILRRLRVVDPEVEKAETFVRENGGADVVRLNPELVDQVAAILHEKATVGMKEILRQGFDDILEKHTARYLKKLESVQDAVITSVKVAQSAIIERLNEGPHELIEDNEIRTIWERNRWKSSVKCRIFVEGLHEHYQREFLKQRSLVPHKDAWTLAFFSRVMYHSAIGDVVDDDGSGYISASEVNDFISEQRSLAHWTKPEWFAFWACGWYNNNAWWLFTRTANTYRCPNMFAHRYYRRIKHIVQETEKSAHAARPEESNGSWHLLQVIIGSLKQLVLVADVEDFSGTVKVPHQLRRLQTEYRAYEEKKIEENLAHFNHHLNDRPSLNAAVGDSRVELHMMPLLYILMMNLQDTVGNITKTQKIGNSDLITIEELATSCIAVFVAFEDRMRDLVRGWRFEGKDIAMQVDRYADGLFRKCYRETRLYQQAYDALRGCIFGSTRTLPRHLRPFEAPTHHKRASDESLTREVAALSERVKAIEAHLAVPATVRPPVPLSRASSPSDGEESVHSAPTLHPGKEHDEQAALPPGRAQSKERRGSILGWLKRRFLARWFSSD
ncbi:hypothetical protein BC628DRAFT_1116440 [Trametes gibbosa]|nr:hypothetical protein BC628DRAFT_1116440 [Trametes gibbosa]